MCRAIAKRPPDHPAEKLHAEFGGRRQPPFIQPAGVAAPLAYLRARRAAVVAGAGKRPHISDCVEEFDQRIGGPNLPEQLVFTTFSIISSSKFIYDRFSCISAAGP